MTKNWEEIKAIAFNTLREESLSQMHLERLQFEISEIEKQCANTIWVDYYNEGKRFDSNPNHLLMPWLLGLLVGEADTDPLAIRTAPLLNSVRFSEVVDYSTKHGDIPPDFVKDPDMPDIDLDCLADARDAIRQHAIEAYSQNSDDSSDTYGSVCSVGTWQTYKFKSAIIDAVDATGIIEKSEAYKLTTELPQDVDELREGGKANCTGKVIDIETGEERECGTSHINAKCPVCGSPDTDNPTIGKLMEDFPDLRQFAKQYPRIIEYAIRLVGRIRNMGMHAGALIIADRPLYGNVPLARRSTSAQWVSMWSEGRNSQLSKLGYLKWDVLSLKTLQQIYNCCKLVEKNRGISFGIRKKWCAFQFKNGTEVPYALDDKVETDHGPTTVEQLMRLVQKKGGSIPPGRKQGVSLVKACDIVSVRLLSDDEAPPAMDGWDDVNPQENRLGHFYDPSGQKHIIALNDEGALKLANDRKVTGIFQFDTNLAISILENGVKSFHDLMMYSALGHPGPMQFIPEAVANRDDPTQSWKHKLHPDLLEILEPTYGVIVFQEQLTAIWQKVAGFTAPEAQAARKAVAKKRASELKEVEKKWMEGASKVLGEDLAREWADKMTSFGRYAFNLSHCVSYILVALRALYLKSNFAPEFWATIMSDCHPDKLVKFMGIARAEGWTPTEVTRLGTVPIPDDISTVAFDTLNVNNLTVNFTADGNSVNQGLIGIKGIGENAADQFAGELQFTDIDDFIEKKGQKSKTVLERLIKLGAFNNVPGHENSYALWQYYQYRYCSGKDITQLRKEIRQMLLERDGWNDQTIKMEIERQTEEYFRVYPNRKKLPTKISNWKPKPNDTRENIMALFADKKFSLREILEFEKEYLGYYVHSPLDLYNINGHYTIDNARAGGDAPLEAIITQCEIATTKAGKDYARIIISDGIQDALVLMWNTELQMQQKYHDSISPTKSESLQEVFQQLVGTGVQMYVQYDPTRKIFTICRNELILKLGPKDAT